MILKKKAASSYFKALFTNGMNDTYKKTVFIGGIDSDTMKLIIEWAYTRSVVIDTSNVEKLLPAADQFQELGLKTKCSEFLENNLHYENVIGIRRFVNAYFCNSLRDSSFIFLMYK